MVQLWVSLQPSFGTINVAAAACQMDAQLYYHQMKGKVSLKLDRAKAAIMVDCATHRNYSPSPTSHFSKQLICLGILRLTQLLKEITKLLDTLLKSLNSMSI